MGALRDGIELWMAVRPFRRWKEHHEAKRAERDGATITALPVSAESGAAASQDAQGDGMSELAKSMARSVLKVLGTAVATYAATHGIVDAGAGDMLYTALEIAGGGLATAIGLILSHRTHKA